MYEKVTAAQVNLVDPATAPELVDSVLKTCVLESRPVYVRLPLDMVKAKVDGTMLDSPFDLSPPPNDEGFEDMEAETILSTLYKAKSPALIIDGFVRAYDIREEVNQLAKALGSPAFTTPFGKSLVSEDVQNFHGIYDPLSASPQLQEYMKTFDLVLRFGPLNSDVNTFGFISPFPHAASINFHHDYIHFSPTPTSSSSSSSIASNDESASDNDSDDTTSESYCNIYVKSLLHKLLDKLDYRRLPQPTARSDLIPHPSLNLEGLGLMEPKAPIHHLDFWTRLSAHLRPHDTIMTETGTASSGGREMILPPKTTLLNSSLWLSIGYMFAAAQGAALAQQELKEIGTMSEGRTILLTGDGSFQMSAQELSTIIRHRIPLTIFLINNDGYTIERYIHGMTATYNDVGRWQYLLAPQFFGAEKLQLQGDESYPIRTYRAETWGELDAALADPVLKEGKGLMMVEVIMGREDAPESLKKLLSGKVEKLTKQAEEMGFNDGEGEGEESKGKKEVEVMAKVAEVVQ